MFKNKKGFITEVLADIYVFIVFLLIMLIFSILFYFGGEIMKTSIKGEYDNLDGNTILLNYLRTPVEVDGKETTIAELILISADSEEHKREFKTLTQDLLNRLNVLSYEDDYSIKVKFPDEEMFVGEVEGVINRLKINKQGQREVGKIMLPSLDKEIYVSIYNYKGDVSIYNFAKEAKTGDKIPSFDGKEYVYWGEELFEYAWSSLGGAWAQEGWPCDTIVKGGKIFCKNGYKPTKDDVPCFVNGQSFVKYNNRPPAIPEKCYNKDVDVETNPKTYAEENEVKTTIKDTGEKTGEDCVITDSSTFSKTIKKAKIGDCVIAPDKIRWTNWGSELGDTSMGDPNYRWWSYKEFCEEKIIQKSFLACNKNPKYPPMNRVGTKDFVQQKELVKKYLK